MDAAMESAAAASVAPPAPPPPVNEAPRKPVTGVLTAFLSKLWKLTQDKNDKVCGWSDDGTKFEVRNDKFEEEMIKKHFHGGNIMTFVRQLHFYGFRKTGEENGRWAFSHPKFRRDSPHLLHQITRKTRTTQTDIAERESLRADLIELRKEVTELRNSLDLRKEFNELREIVMSLQSKQGGSQATATPVLKKPDTSAPEPTEVSLDMQVPPSSIEPASPDATEKREREEDGGEDGELDEEGKKRARLVKQSKPAKI